MSVAATARGDRTLPGLGERQGQNDRGKRAPGAAAVHCSSLLDLPWNATEGGRQHPGGHWQGHSQVSEDEAKGSIKQAPA
jgi:hypothetical protein